MISHIFRSRRNSINRESWSPSTTRLHFSAKSGFLFPHHGGSQRGWSARSNLTSFTSNPTAIPPPAANLPEKNCIKSQTFLPTFFLNGNVISHIKDYFENPPKNHTSGSLRMLGQCRKICCFCFVGGGCQWRWLLYLKSSFFCQPFPKDIVWTRST